MLSRVGILPLVTFVLFYRAQVAVNGWIADQGWVPPTLEGLFPFLLGQQVLTFVLYAIILDFADYWRHRLAHQFRWWWALHSLHHAQRQMTFWSDDRNHVLDDLIAFVWFGVIALLIGVPPLQFPLLVLVLRFLESLSHANVRLSFGWLGERLLISPRFHRAHHGVLAAGERSCNYGAVLPWWDMLFGTADFSRDYVRDRRSVGRGSAGTPAATCSSNGPDCAAWSAAADASPGHRVEEARPGLCPGTPPSGLLPPEPASEGAAFGTHPVGEVGREGGLDCG